jgi:hypothetical protein
MGGKLIKLCLPKIQKSPRKFVQIFKKTTNAFLSIISKFFKAGKPPAKTGLIL